MIYLTNKTQNIDSKLIKFATDARNFSYAPYSKFSVGTALLCKNLKIFTGCNIENASFSATNCAERTAFFKAISNGEKDFSAIAIVGGNADDSIKNFCFPCGVCLQVMSEFCDVEKFTVILYNGKILKKYKLCELLPQSFNKNSL